MTVGRMCVVMMCVLGLTSVASADEKPPEEQEQIVAKAEKVGRARFIDFASELGLPLASLDSLGERIDNARFEADPVELASIAKILGAAERATGKKASLTSEKISAEAAALAKQRGDLAELAMVAQLVGGSAAKELQAVAEAVKDRTASEADEESRALYGMLTVRNLSFSGVRVFANGYPLGFVPPQSVRRFPVSGAHYVVARDRFGNRWSESFRWRDRQWGILTIPPSQSPFGGSPFGNLMFQPN